MNKRFPKIATLFAVISISLISAGQTPPAYGSEVMSTPTVDTSHPRAKIVVASEALVGQIVVIDPKFRELGKLTQTQLTLQNLTENRYTIEYKFDWEDAQGFKIEGPSVWRTQTMTPHLVTNLNSTGKTPQAKNIIFTIRFPDNVFIEQDKQMQMMPPVN
jgi:uncharacterized protein YcfL